MKTAEPFLIPMTREEVITIMALAFYEANNREPGYKPDEWHQRTLEMQMRAAIAAAEKAGFKLTEG